MYRWLLTRLIKSGERELGVPGGFAFFLRDVAPNRLVRFAFIRWVEGRRQIVSRGAYHAAGLASAMAEDCGSCVQIHVNLALKDGIAPELVQALVDRRLEQVAPEMAEAFRFGEAVSGGAPSTAYRDAIRGRWGDSGLAELAFAVAVARFYPGLKRGLGFAESCEKVAIPSPAHKQQPVPA